MFEQVTARLAADFRDPQTRRLCGSWGLSTIVHLTLFAVLASLWNAVRLDDGSISIASNWNAPATNSSAVDTTIDTEALGLGGEAGTPRGDPSLSTELFASAGESNVVTPTLAVGDDAIPEWFASAVPSEALAARVGTSHVGAVGPTGGSPDGKGGSGGGNGTGDGTKFFGMNAPGKRFVYVVDRSKSMNHPDPTPAKTRFGRVKLELLKSIGKLQAEQRFFVIFFNDTPLPMPSRMMQAGVPGAQRRYLEWVATVPAEGFTDPTDSLLLALDLKPDVIYFLTDGDFKRGVINKVTEANQNKVAIHTFCLGDPSGEDLLREIAARNGGEYQFIP